MINNFVSFRMKIKDFYNHFSDEESCKLKFKSIRDQQGVVCKKRSRTEHYWHQHMAIRV